MSFFRKWFGGPAAPDCEVHQADEWLVRAEDRDWWRSLSTADYEAMAQEDNAFKVMFYAKVTESDGLSKELALQRVTQAFPVYYLSAAERSAGTGFDGPDAKLPYSMKRRINRFTVEELPGEPGLLTGITSFNALVRDLARQGRL